MQPELLTRRRALRLTLERYDKADREWRDALVEMRSWFPMSAGAFTGAMGNPGSRIRKIYDTRARALMQFEVALQKFENARQRQSESHASRRVRVTMLHGSQYF
ncbi:hypothetical protein [Phaeobacter sp. 22II1-1F12B]|uniref:hypothetical protein n=1 Tax=Phaeobacter sp. 22II1-1F12B TaxID=1317111 RepID=UPI000B51FBD3|nr:hypothetical protein [Phaeobacter sp. 22II1-1F12B]OWU77152.1 hypothetical protein ATO1_16090 [Phaeobacter sp. 22II1-1F12B]